MDTDEFFEFSEFSMFEILYQGSETLTYVVEELISADVSDPFEILCQVEERIGMPIVFSMFNTKGESPM